MPTVERGPNMRVLVVDDSKAMRMLVARCLKKADLGKLEILEACNGVEGLDLAKSQRLDLILTDWNMPEMSGLQLIQMIKSEEIKVRIGVVTSDVAKKTESEAREAGALFVIGKPFGPAVFKEHIDRAFGKVVHASAPQPTAGPIAARLPQTVDVAQALCGLLPRGANATLTTKIDIKKAGAVVVATYAHEQEVRGICACELRIALGLGAAMTLFPKTLVEDGVRHQSMPVELNDNVRELFNVLGSMFAPSTLQDVILPPNRMPLDLKAKIAAASSRMDITVNVSGYDSGWMIMALA